MPDVLTVGASVIQFPAVERDTNLPCVVISTPEFLKEDSCQNPMRPADIIIGSDDGHATQQVRELYAAFNRSRNRLIAMDVRNAEISDYAPRRCSRYASVSRVSWRT